MTMDEISVALGIEILDIQRKPQPRRKGPEGPVWVLVTPTGTVEMSAHTLADPQRATKAIVNATGQLVNYFTPARWRQIAQAITKAAVPLGLTDDQIRKWVGNFVESHPTETTIEAGVEHGNPFEHQGAVWFRSKDLRAWISAEYGIDLAKTKLSEGLSRIGIDWARLNGHVVGEGTTPKRRTQYSCYPAWRTDREFTKEQEPA